MEATVGRGWRKSSYSGNGGQCVEVADDDTSRVLVRDTKDTAGPTLRFSPNAWRRLLNQVKSDASLGFCRCLQGGTPASGVAPLRRVRVSQCSVPALPGRVPCCGFRSMRYEMRVQA
jgi:hypothetical protein